MKATHRTFTDEFKADVVKRYLAGESAKALTEKFKISSGMLSNWKKRYGSKVKKVADTAVKQVTQDLIRATRRRPSLHGGAHTAAIYLRQAQEALLKGLRSGKIPALDKVHLMTLLALEELSGD